VWTKKQALHVYILINFSKFPKLFAKWTPQRLISGYSAAELMNGSFNVPFPQRVDERIQHRINHCKHHWGHWAVFVRMWYKWTNINSKASAIKRANNWQVRPTGGEGFILPTWWWDPHNGRNNFVILEKDSWEW
jgi:hypothetical protein